MVGKDNLHRAEELCVLVLLAFQSHQSLAPCMVTSGRQYLASWGWGAARVDCVSVVVGTEVHISKWEAVSWLGVRRMSCEMLAVESGT